MFKMENMRDLRGRIPYMFLYSPDQYPYEDFLSDENQMNLDLGFSQLHQGVEIALPPKKYPEAIWDKKRKHLHDLLNESYRLFKTDDPAQHDKARMMLDDFDMLIFKGK